MKEEKERKKGAPKKDPRHVRSERVNIVLTPETLDNLKTLVAMNNESLNNFIHQLIDEEIQKEKIKIKKYRKFMENIGK